MYVWIWRHLPGGLPGRLIGSLVLLAGAVALLFFLVFPWAEPRLPFNDVTVDQSGGSSSTNPSANPSSVPSATPTPAVSPTSTHVRPKPTASH